MEYILLLTILIFIIKNWRINLKSNEIIITDEFKDIINILNESNDNIFITGKAGTGKSTLLNYFKTITQKKYVVLAPTGIAALNVKGQTIHSFFRFPPQIINPEEIQPDYVRADLFLNLEMIIIDEVSMVRSDLMHGIDIALRKNRNRSSEPFGGVQMVFIGDMFQLPPVLTEQDRSQILSNYNGVYFFDAPVFLQFQYQFKQLTRIFRQSENERKFINLLNNIRTNQISFDDMVLLNSRHKQNVGEQKNSIFLTTRKKIARNLNKEKLDLLPGQEFIYLGELTGKYVKYKTEDDEKLESKLPAPYILKLKRNAQIMMLKNDPNKRWVNGSIGWIEKLENQKIIVNINGNKHRVEKENWNEVEYVLDKETNNLKENIIAGFKQYPLQLSYAMTIHKSQGKTFESITIDVGSGAFAHGQIYVALSRCKSLNGIILNNPIKNSDIIIDPRISEYYKIKSIPQNRERTELKNTKNIRNVLEVAILQKKSISIEYINFNGEISTRELSQIEFCKELSFDDQHIKAFCHLRNEERHFKVSRIRNIKILEKI